MVGAKACLLYGGLALAAAASLVAILNTLPDIFPTEPASPNRQVRTALTATPRATYDTTAVKLFLAYRQNRISADHDIGNARVSLAGGVESIDRGNAGTPLLAFDIGMDLYRVYAYLPNSDERHLAQLARGDWVHLLCDRSTVIQGNPVLTGCALQP